MRLVNFLILGLVMMTLPACATPTGRGGAREIDLPAVTPFLLYEDGHAEEAMQLYADLFPDSQIVTVERYGSDEAGPEGTIKRGFFELNGQRMQCTDATANHGATFSPIQSLFVDVASPKAFERLFQGLSLDGQVLMPPDDYGFSIRFTWITDRFGVS